MSEGVDSPSWVGASPPDSASRVAVRRHVGPEVDMSRRLIVPILPRIPISGLLKLALATVIVACGGGDSPTGPSTPPPAEQLLIQIVSGDGQTARVGSPVGSAPTIRVLRAGGSGVSGVSVTFSVALGGGSVTSSTVATNSSGEASTGWTLGSSVGQNQVRVTASGVAGSLTFSATARHPYWAVMVYMAADNSLADAGLVDLIEMYAAGDDPEVQVVVQAEFSPSHLTLGGCDAACLPGNTFNTTRFSFSDYSPVNIGNQDMTDPAVLRDFVRWARTTYPAERFILIPWNHGGGYAGLIEDQTSAGGQLMSLEEFRSALVGLDRLDIIDFDMCLMGGYETLTTVRGLTEYAVFSEENEPAAGNPYDLIIDAIQANPTASTADIASMMVDAYHTSYTGHRASTTKSAYALDGLDQFEVDLAALASYMTANLPTLRGAIQDAVNASQKFSNSVLTDVVDFLDQLSGVTSDPALTALINQLRASATGPFRVNTQSRNGAGSTYGDVPLVSRASGLHIVFPSGIGTDQFPSAGRSSFAAYSAEYPANEWTGFLQEWNNPLGSVTYLDQGASPLQLYLVWSEEVLGVDIDLFILQPDGVVYSPIYGTVTPNGTLSGESSESDVPLEGMTTYQFVQTGEYVFYAFLYADPNDTQPFYDVAFRHGFSADWSWLYSPDSPQPQLSMTNSFVDDPTPTDAELEAGVYSDLQVAATWSPGVGAALVEGRSDAARSAPEGPSLTHDQLEALQDLIAGRVKRQRR